MKRISSPIRRFGAACFLLAATTCAGQDGEGSEADIAQAELAPVCPFCDPQAGGESSDFDGGSILATSCRALRIPRLIDVAEATALGFDMDSAVPRMEAPIDVPIFLGENSFYSSEIEATGYEPEMRLQARLHVDSWAVMELDPARCDGTTCTAVDGEVVELDDCRPQLEWKFSVDMTIDELLVDSHSTGKGQFRLNEDGSYRLAGSAETNLLEVRGTLKLSEPKVEGIHQAWLRSDFYFPPEGATGDLRIQILTTDPDVDFHVVANDFPLQGHWPDPPEPREPEEGSAGVDGP